MNVESALQRFKLLPFAIILALTLLAYYPALGGSFVWDDEYLVISSPLIKSPVFILEVFRHYLYPFSTSAYYRPLQNVSYIADYWFWNKNPFGYHLTNLLLHATSAGLLFQLLKKRIATLDLLPKESVSAATIALAISAIWVVHPIHNAVAAYVSGRADSLAAVCALAGWLIYLEAAESLSMQKTALLHVFAWSFGFLALCAKEIAFVWLGVFLLVEVLFNTESAWSRKMKVGSGLVCLVLAYAWIHHELGARAVPATEHPIIERTFLALRSLGEYISLFVFPANLHMERSLNDARGFYSPIGWANAWKTECLPLFGAVGLFTLLYLAIRKSPHRRLIQLGAAWFVVGFVPISNLFPLGAESAEHWIYIPSIGLLLVGAAVAANVSTRVRPIIPFAFAATVVLLTVRTNLRSRDWLDEKTLYTQTVQAGGVSVRSLVNLARAEAKSGNETAAGALLQRAVTEYPSDSTARMHLGLHYFRLGETSTASKWFASSADAETESCNGSAFWTGAVRLAQITSEEGEVEKALAILKQSSKANPDAWQLVKLEADLVEKSHGAGAGIELIQAYVSSHWWNYEAVQYLALKQAEIGEFQKSFASFAAAAKLDVHASEPFDVAAHVAFHQGLWSIAGILENEAISRDPGRADQSLFLSRILEKLERATQSQAALESSVALGNPGGRTQL